MREAARLAPFAVDRHDAPAAGRERERHSSAARREIENQTVSDACAFENASPPPAVVEATTAK